jgi:hypothetical protein
MPGDDNGDDNGDGSRENHQADGDQPKYERPRAKACGRPALRGAQFRRACRIAERALQLSDQGFRIVLRVHTRMLPHRLQIGGP